MNLWILGWAKPKWKQSTGRFTLYYRFDTTFVPVMRMRMKIEINTREHFDVLGLRCLAYAVTNPWFSGRAEVVTYSLAELLGTKMRALYQRKKGRDLFDLWLGLTEHDVNPTDVVHSFAEYMRAGGSTITRAQFEANLAAKLRDSLFGNDIAPLIRSGLNYDVQRAWDVVHEKLVLRLPGEPWQGSID